MRKDSPALSLAGSPGNSETPTSNLHTVQLMLQRTFYYNTGIQNLVFCQGNFSFVIHPLVYRCPNHSVIVCIAKKASKGRSLGTQMECESDFFFFFVFGIPYFQKHFPSNPMVVVFACYAFSVPNILLRHSKGTFVTFYRSSFSSTWSTVAKLFSICRVPGSFHQHRCRKMEAVLSQLPQFPHSGQQICSTLTLSSLLLSQRQEAIFPQ